MNDPRFLPGPLNRPAPQTVDLIPRPYLEAVPPAASADESEHHSMMVYWRILVRHKVTILLAVLLGIMAGVMVTLPQTPVYQATVAIEVQSLNEDFLNMRNINPTATNDYYDPYYEIQTRVREMQSRPLMERVVKKLNSGDLAALTMDTGRVSTWRRALHLAEPKPPSTEQAVRSANVKFKPSLTNRIVEISCDSVNPKVAAKFANTLAEEYIQQNLENRWDSSQKTGEFLTRQLQDLKIRLEKSEDELQAYSHTAGLMYVTDGDKNKENVADEKLRQLQSELLKAESDRVAKQSRYELTKSSPAESLAEVLEDKTLSDYQGKLTDLRRQMAENNLALTPDNPKMKRLQAQVDALEAALKQSRADIVERVANDYQAALNREKLLNVEFTSQKDLVSDQSAKVIHYNILKREVDTNRQIYDAMLQKVKEFGIASAMKASGITIVEPAVPPASPYQPNLRRAGILGLFAGLAFGVMFVFVRERSDRNLQQPGDAAFYLNVPELGVIPTSSADRSPSRSRKPSDGLVKTGDAERVELVTWTNKMSMLAEAFRTTLTSLLFSGHNGIPPRLIVLTSASPSEGKTTVSVNLAIALAEINRRVLLIDADMRRPRMQNIFQLGNGIGLSDLLSDKSDSEPIPASRAACPTSIPGLYVMRSGGNPGVVSNLLHSARLPELMQELRGEFDSIVIDTPPALHISDARVIGRFADAVVLVVRAGKTTRDAAMMVKQRFGEDGAPVLGTILNAWDAKRDVYGYKYRYYNGSGAYYRRPDASEEEKA